MSAYNDIASLKSHVERLERELSHLPSRWAGAAPTRFTVIKITGGNTLATGQAGIKYSSSAITTVGSDYDPDVDTSFIDGIGRADLYIDGVLQTGKVLVVLDTSSVIDFALIQNDVAYAVSTKTLVGATRVYYIPGWL